MQAKNDCKIPKEIFGTAGVITIFNGVFLNHEIKPVFKYRTYELCGLRCKSCGLLDEYHY